MDDSINAERFTYLANLLPNDVYSEWFKGMILDDFVDKYCSRDRKMHLSNKDRAVFDFAMRNARLQTWFGQPLTLALDDISFCRQISIIESMKRPVILQSGVQSLSKEDRRCVRWRIASSLVTSDSFSDQMARGGLKTLVNSISKQYGKRLLCDLGCPTLFSNSLKPQLNRVMVGDELSFSTRMYCIMSPALHGITNLSSGALTRIWGMVNLYYVFCETPLLFENIETCIAFSLFSTLQNGYSSFFPGPLSHVPLECAGLGSFFISARSSGEKILEEKEEHGEESVVSATEFLFDCFSDAEDLVFDKEAELMEHIESLSSDALDILYDTQTEESLFDK